MFVIRNNIFQEEEFITRKTSGRTVQLKEVKKIRLGRARQVMLTMLVKSTNPWQRKHPSMKGGEAAKEHVRQ